MANYEQSALAKAQGFLTSKWNAPELRSAAPHLLSLAIKNKDICIPSVEQLRVHENRVVDVNFFTKKPQGNGTAKQANHTGSKGDSSKINLTYITHVEPFSVNAKLANNNLLSYEQILQNELEQAWLNLLSRHNESAAAYLQAHRMQLTAAQVDPIIASSGAGVWDDTSKKVVISAQNEHLRLQLAEQFMQARNFIGQYDCVADIRTWGRLSYLINQGAGNNQNLAYQFGNSAITTTPYVIDAGASNGAFYLMPKGTFAAINWNDPLNLSNKAYDATTGKFGVLQDPFGLGIFADLSVYTGRTNSSSTDSVGGSTQDVKEEYELTLTMAYALAPLSAQNDAVATLFAVD